MASNAARHAGAAVALVLGALATSARAQPDEEAPPTPEDGGLPKSSRTEAWFKGTLAPEPLSEVDKTAARMALDTGRAKFDEGDFAAALESLRSAHAMIGLPVTGGWLARAQEKAGMLVEATATLQRLQRFPQQPNEPAAFAGARARAATLHAEFVTRTPTIAVEVDGIAAGAAYEVTIDGARLPAAGRTLPVPVDPGEHQISVSAPGYETAGQGVTVKEKERPVLKVTLRPAPKKQAAASPPPDETPAPAPAFSGPNIPVWALVGFSAAGAGLVGGVVAGALSLGRARQLEERCPARACTEAERADYDLMIALANVSNASFALAGAGAAVGIVGLVIADGQDGDARVSLEPTIGGATLRASF